jgi:hypothetical protein
MKSKINPLLSWKSVLPLLVLLFPLAAGTWVGCGKPGANAPVNPSLGQNLTVNLQASKGAHTALLGSASNAVYYCVSGSGMSPVTGMVGPFSTASDSGTVSVSLLVPQGLARLMAFEIVDADNSAYTPMALGAIQTDITSEGVTSTVEMGSLIRNCYNQRATYFQEGCYFAFQSESLADATTVSSSTGYDIYFLPNGGTFQLDALNGDNLAYMGNNNLVDDAAAPSSGYVTDSTTAKTNAGISVTDPQVGDVFCIKLGSNGFAWVYITDMGLGPGTSSPSFEFRLNSNLNYYGYQQTQADEQGPCSTPIPTPTPCTLC